MCPFPNTHPLLHPQPVDCWRRSCCCPSWSWWSWRWRCWCPSLLPWSVWRPPRPWSCPSSLSPLSLVSWPCSCWRRPVWVCPCPWCQWCPHLPLSHQCPLTECPRLPLRTSPLPGSPAAEAHTAVFGMRLPARVWLTAPTTPEAHPPPPLRPRAAPLLPVLPARAALARPQSPPPPIKDADWTEWLAVCKRSTNYTKGSQLSWKERTFYLFIKVPLSVPFSPTYPSKSMMTHRQGKSIWIELNLRWDSSCSMTCTKYC